MPQFTETRTELSPSGIGVPETRLLSRQTGTELGHQWESFSSAVGPGAFPGLQSPLRSVLWVVHVVTGIVCLIGLLAVLAAIPGLSLLALGLMLAAEAEVARTGKLRYAFPLLPVSTRTGMILLVVGVFLLPIWLASSLAAAHGVIAQSSPTALNPQRVALVVLQVLIFIHLAAAIACGGTLWRFVRPFRNIWQLAADLQDGSWRNAINRWSEWLMAVFRPVDHLILAVKATVGAVIWLIVPTAMLGLSTYPHDDPFIPAVVSLIGGVLMIPVASWLPLLQAHQAVTGQFRDIFDVRVVCDIISRVPVHWAIATVLLYAAAIPLYLTKLRLLADDANWLLTPLFVVLIYPARLMFGWVYARGRNRQIKARRLVRWPVTAIIIPVIAAYAVILFVTPLVSEAGHAAIFENHAFLLPIPGRLFGS